MVLVQTLVAWAACIAQGTSFVEALAADSTHPLAVLSVVLGGVALAVGDFSAAAAIERLGIAVGGPTCFSCMLICGGLGDFLLEGSAKPPLLFSGVAGCILAVLADSQSHVTQPASIDAVALAKSVSSTVDAAALAEPPCHVVIGVPQVRPAEAKGGQDAAPLDAQSASMSAVEPGDAARRSEFVKGMAVAIVGGTIGGLWTVLSTLASRVHELRPATLLFYFHLGELLAIVPVVLAYGRLFGGATTGRGLWRMLRTLRRRQVKWTSGAGLCIALGYLCYFATKGDMPRPVAYAVGCSAGSMGMLYGLLYFGEYKKAPREKRLLLLCALGLYPSSIALIACSMA